MVRRSIRPARVWRLGALALLVVVALVLVPLSLRSRAQPAATAPLPTLSQAPTEPRVVIMGGGAAAGAGASKPSERWTTLTSKTLGWQELNKARAGTHYGAVSTKATCTTEACLTFQTSLDTVVKASPQVVVVATELTSTASSTGDVSSFYRALRAALPNATIIAVGPWASDSKTARPAQALDTSVGASVRAVRGVYISLTSPELIDATMTARGGTVLNDIGHQAVADRVIGALDDSSGSSGTGTN